jgi:ABC-type methionine transport system ATPase subunit
MPIVSLLSLAGVTKYGMQGGAERALLKNVSLELGAGEMLAVWGSRRAAREALLDIACGIQQPDQGAVMFLERPFRGKDVLGREIGQVSDYFHPGLGRTVMDQIAITMLMGSRRGMRRKNVRGQAFELLSDHGLEAWAQAAPSELDVEERMMVGIVRALALTPRLLLLDEPTNGTAGGEGPLNLLRTAMSDCISVLFTTSDSLALVGADQTTMID